MKLPSLLLISVLLSACVSSGPATKPTEVEWNGLLAEYQSLETLRRSAPQPPAGATRRQQIEILLATHQKLEPVYEPLMDRLREYYDRTLDARAAQLYAREKVVMGDQYMNVLARYDRAIGMYQEALALDPLNQQALNGLRQAEQLRYIRLEPFSTIRAGMKEDEVRKAVGTPREDWIKQVIQKNRVYTVWIYPRQDGGASAIYFDNGVVYHTNWNAAPGRS
jgi:hypothetical protein